ncbi:MAG: hypothetical protein Q7U10_03910 [Thermodesulfovibrionia bacterium]|nr:hypothetical protein [Thermodesulfovibrionia bacterium]
MFNIKPLSGRNKFLLALLTVAVTISILLSLFVTSPAFLKAVAVYAGRLTGMRVEIGSISIPERNRVVIERLSVEKEKDRFHLSVPYVEIRFTLKGLLKKNIEGLILRDPEMTVTLKKEPRGKTSLPFTFNTLAVSEADVTVNYEDSEPLHISPATLTLIRQPDGQYGDLQGRAFISGLNTTVSLASEIDMKTFDFKKIKIDVSPIDLKSASAKYPLSLLKLAQLKGTCSLNMDMEREDKGNDMVLQAEALIDNLSFSSETLGINLGDSPLKISAKGRYRPSIDSAEIESASADLAELNILKAKGTIGLLSAGTPDMRITANIKSIPLEKIKGLLYAPEAVWLAKGDADGTVSADVTVSGSYTVPQIQGVVDLQGKTLSVGNTTVQAFLVRLPFEYQGSSLLIKQALIQAGSATVSRNGKKYFTEKNILIKGGIEGDITGHMFKGKNFLINAGFFKGLAASAEISTSEPITINADLNYNSVDIEEVSRAFPHNIFTEKGYTISGTGALHMTGKIVIPKNNASHISGITSGEFTNSGLSSADGSVICEGIQMKASAEFESFLQDGTVSFSAEAGAVGFELLADKFYGSFKDRPIALSASGTYDWKSDTLHIIKAKTGLHGIGEVVLSGTISDISKTPYFDASLQAGGISNSEAYNFFVRETFQEQVPILSRLKVSGRSYTDLNVKGTKESFTINGDLHVDDMDISAEAKENHISGVQISLPVNLAYPEPLHKEKVKNFGTIMIKDLSWSTLKLNDIALSPSIWQNDIILKDDVRVPLYGGEVILKNISYGSIFGKTQQLLLSVDIKDIDLEKASVALELPKFRGNISGAIPKALFSNNTLFTEGEMTLELFGGRMKLYDLSADNVFSLASSLKAGIKFDEIDLGKLTGTFDFGHISGIMRGEISELVIVNGEAEHFRASLETYKKKGVKQKISVEALKKISILGTGTSTSILDKGIYQLFKEYGYEKIGFRAYLKNDNLRLIGIEDGGGKIYLVKGSLLPPKVNVINFNQNISFKEMVSRLKRITAAEK